jgi:hypothetical protein
VAPPAPVGPPDKSAVKAERKASKLTRSGTTLPQVTTEVVISPTSIGLPTP